MTSVADHRIANTGADRSSRPVLRGLVNLHHAVGYFGSAGLETISEALALKSPEFPLPVRRSEFRVIIGSNLSDPILVLKTEGRTAGEQQDKQVAHSASKNSIVSLHADTSSQRVCRPDAMRGSSRAVSL